MRGLVSPAKPYFFLNLNGNEPLLMFPNEPVEFEVKMIKNEEANMIDYMAEISQRIAKLIGLFGTLIVSLIGISIFSNGDCGAAVKMLRLFKVIYR